MIDAAGAAWACFASTLLVMAFAYPNRRGQQFFVAFSSAGLMYLGITFLY